MKDPQSPPRRRLTDILNGGADRLRAQWNDTQAADEFKPLPSGTYEAYVMSGELFTSRTNSTPGYKLCFKVIEPSEHAGRQFWHDLWLSAPALSMTKRDLAKLGVTAVEQLETPLPVGIRCEVKLVLRREDDGTEYNRIRSFDVVGVDPPTVDPFAPDNSADEDAVVANTPAEETATTEGGDHVPF